MIRTYPRLPVCKKGDKIMSLTEVFENLKLRAYDLSVDMLDVHAVCKFTMRS